MLFFFLGPTTLGVKRRHKAPVQKVAHTPSLYHMVKRHTVR